MFSHNEDIHKFHLAAADYTDDNFIKEYFLEMAGRDRREITSYLRVLLVHMIKIAYQPKRLSISWIKSARNSLIELQDCLEESPSLLNELKKKFNKIYDTAYSIAHTEMCLNKNKSNVPKKCPWSLEELLNNKTEEIIEAAIKNNNNPFFKYKY